MKAAKLRELTSEELAERLDEAGKELFDIRVRVATGDASEKPLKRRFLRREAARIKTLMRERQDVN
jgi:large subunit ribosomal protein L29